MNTQETVVLTTTIDGMAGNSISLYGPQSGDVQVDFNAEGAVSVPLDVAATCVASGGFFVGLEDVDRVAQWNAHRLELASAPIPTYDAGDEVELLIPSLGLEIVSSGLPSISMVAGDNLEVVFNSEGRARCGRLTAQTFLEAYPDAKITPEQSEDAGADAPDTSLPTEMGAHATASADVTTDAEGAQTDDDLSDVATGDKPKRARRAASNAEPVDTTA